MNPFCPNRDSRPTQSMPALRKSQQMACELCGLNPCRFCGLASGSESANFLPLIALDLLVKLRLYPEMAGGNGVFPFPPVG